MLEFVSFNHKISPISAAQLPAASAAAFYGRGVFTSVAISRGEPFLWERHWRRLNDDAARVNLDLSGFREAEARQALTATLAANNLSDGRARLTFFDQSLSGVWNLNSERKIAFLAIVAERRVIARNFRLAVSPSRVNSASILSGVKSCNYLENLLALEQARREGFDEALRLNEKGEVVAACAANVFWAKNGVIFTPPLATGALAGTTRGFLLDNVAVVEKRAQLEELTEADEIFLTSAGFGARRVESFGEKNYAETAIFERVKAILSDVFES